MTRWIRRNWLVLAFAAVNLAVAAPASATLGDDLCYTNDGGLVHCCTLCVIDCGCTVN